MKFFKNLRVLKIHLQGLCAKGFLIWSYFWLFKRLHLKRLHIFGCLAIFPLKDFILVLQYFSLKTGSLSNRWLKPKFNYFFLALLLFFQKIHMSSFISDCSICTYFRKYYIYWSNFFIIFVTNKIFKIFLSKKSLLHTSILLICTSHIRIGFSYWWSLCFSISVSPKFYPFLYAVKKVMIYDNPLDIIT